jgi:hypothetical protein
MMRTCPSCGKPHPGGTRCGWAPDTAPLPVIRWIDLVPWWERITTEAHRRQAQKRGFKSGRHWNADTDFVGLCGEVVFAVQNGLEVDWSLRLDGDGGVDFIVDGETVNVKATPYWRDPYLKAPKGDNLTAADWYALTPVDLPGQRGYYVARVRRRTLEDAPVRTWGDRNIPTRSLSAADVRRLGRP